MKLLERRKDMDRNIDCILVIARETMNANWRAKGRGIGRYTPTLEHSFRFVEADLFELMMTWNCLLFDEALETINLRYQLFPFREKWIIRFQGISKNIFGTIFIFTYALQLIPLLDSFVKICLPTNKNEDIIFLLN